MSPQGSFVRILNGIQVHSARNTPFVEEAKVVLQEVRTSLAALVGSVGANPTQPQEISRRFGLDKTLTWKIARVICDDDTLAAAVHVPGRASVRNFVEVLESKGATLETTAPVLAAMDRFEQLIATHSGDRGTFEVMLGNASDGLARKSGEAARKMAYQGSSAIWGVRARVHTSLHFVAPNAANDDVMDLGVVAGFVDFRRLRPDVPWAVARRATLTTAGVPQAMGSIVPMDPELGPSDPPILRRFSSTPVPQLRQTPGQNHITRFELTEGPIGNTAAATCILGWIARGESNKYKSEGDVYGEHIVRLSTPVEVLYHDLYVHRSLGFAMKPEIFIYSDLPGGPTFPYDGLERGRLPVMEDVIDLGEGPPNAAAADLPNYRQMVDFAAERLGWSLNDFHGFRFRLKFPPIPTLCLYRYGLAER
jgi:hypothetical protein